MKTRLISRGKLNWLLRDSSVVVFDNFQATIYHNYGALTKTPIGELKKRVIESKENELTSWVDVIELTQSLGIIGYGTSFRESWLKELEES